ncbi:hypothetical protein [Deinococcus arcticus]|uniref:Peptidase C39-like domain-containing protein n=1 Tax=Deinococcus arcticus TaxID=2136176 RepID=A0A2T3W6N5_9DEIO|nr:hypothetical protein [Deinococcus arcticus]PTA67561.1 hypothetical protein C8263_12040 [Deinococcus arcticus]
MAEPVVFPGPRPPKDGLQPPWRGGLVGCGALSAATLLRVQAGRQGLNLPARDELARELAVWQGAFAVPLTGGWRATWPWRWLGGLNGYLAAGGLPLRARGLWGVHRGPVLERHLARLFAAGVPVVGLEFSLRQQHYGVLRAYQPGGDLRAVLNANGEPLILSPRVGVGGVFWVEPR